MSESRYIIDATSENFETYVLQNSHSIPVLVDFWAEWCQPCKMLLPLLAKLAEEYNGKFILAKVNTEEQQALAQQFGIRSIPSVKLFQNGEAVDEFNGALPEAEIRAFLGRYITSESEKLIAQANQLIQQGSIDDATRLIEEARESEPGNAQILIAYARLKASLGDIEEAKLTLNDLPQEAQESEEVIGLRARFEFDHVVASAPDAKELTHAVANGTADSEQLYQLAAHRIMENDLQAALDLLLQLMSKDRKYGDDAGRKGMLSIFSMLGGSGELVNHYRKQMFNLLH